MQLALVTVLVLGHVMCLALAFLVGMPLWKPGGTRCQRAGAEALPSGVDDLYQVAHLRAFVGYQALHCHRRCDINNIHCMQLHPSAATRGGLQLKMGTSIPEAAIMDVQYVDIGMLCCRACSCSWC